MNDNSLVSLQAEQSVIGGLLLNNEAYDLIVNSLSASHFSDSANATIYKALTRLIDAGKQADLLVLAEALESDGSLEDVGGLGYLTVIARAVPSAANVRRYAEIVAEKAMMRGGIRAAAMMIDSLRHGGPAPADTLLRTASELEALAEQSDSDDAMTMTAADIARVTLEQIQRVYESGIDAMPSVPLGFPDLDRVLCGGVYPGDLIIVGARPAMGKTAFLQTIAAAIASPGHRNGGAVLFFSMEMGEAQLGPRQLAGASGIALDAIREAKIGDDQWVSLTDGVRKMSEMRLIVDMRPGLCLAQVRAKARKIRRKEGGLAAVVVDYLQLMQEPGQENRQNEISTISRGLKQLAKELQCPVIALSQLSRSLEARSDKRPMMSDLRESGSLEQDADIVLFLYRDEYYHPDTDMKGLVEVIVSKNRMGEAGRSIFLQFAGELAKMRSLAPGWMPAPKPQQEPKRRREL